VGRRRQLRAIVGVPQHYPSQPSKNRVWSNTPPHPPPPPLRGGGFRLALATLCLAPLLSGCAIIYVSRLVDPTDANVRRVLASDAQSGVGAISGSTPRLGACLPSGEVLVVDRAELRDNQVCGLVSVWPNSNVRLSFLAGPGPNAEERCVALASLRALSQPTPVPVPGMGYPGMPNPVCPHP
jgi:hypothetical protein